MMEDFTDLYGPDTRPRKSVTEKGRAIFKAFSTKFVYTKTKETGASIPADLVIDRASLETMIMPFSSDRIYPL